MTLVRKAGPHDLDTVAGLFNQYRMWYGKDSDLPGAKKFLDARQQQNESVIFVVEQEGVVVAFTQLYPLFSSTRMKRLWLLNDLFVAEEHRGRGHSKALLERAKAFCVETEACGFMLETAK
ncbi:MAG: N-acetyltransferase, partial [Cyclobacteriaceae bacterium]